MNPIVRPSQHIFKVPKACYGKAIHDCCMTSGLWLGCVSKYHGKLGSFSLGMYLKPLKIGSVDIVSSVKCCPKTIQEISEEFSVEFRLL